MNENHDKMEKGTIIVNPDGNVKFFCKAWIPKSPPIAAVLHLHGLGEHICRYDRMFEKFKANGIIVLGFDFKGFGATFIEDNVNIGHIFHGSGNRGKREASLKKDFTFFYNILDGLCGGNEKIPKFVSGHSMGGLLALYLTHECPLKNLKGVLALSPALGVSSPLPPIKVFLGQILAKVIGTVPVTNELDCKSLSRIPEEIDRYQKDPLVHPWVSLKTADFILSTGDAMMSKAATTAYPALFLAHGTLDHLTSHSHTKKFFEDCAVKDKVFKSYEGAFHELHLDLDSERAIKDYIDWIKNHLK